MDCRYCFTEHYPHRMSYQVAEDTVNWLIQNINQTSKQGSIGFFGGEPLLEWETIIKPLTIYIKEKLKNNMINLGITTNCLLLDEEKLKFMKKYDIGLLISMDGNKDTQDYNRPCKNGESSFDILNSKMKLIYSYFPQAIYRSTLIPATCHNYCDNLDYAKSLGFQNSFVIINEFENWEQKERNIVEQELRKYSNYLIYCCRNNLNFIRQRTFEQAINKIVTNNCQLILHNEKKRIDFSDKGRSCGLGSGYGAINYKGDIFTCQEVSSRSKEKDIFYIGNIYSGIDNNKRKQLFNEVYKNSEIKNSLDLNKCKICPIESSCNVNSCIVNNYLNNKTFDMQSDNMCWWHNALAKEAQYVCCVLGEENNTNFLKYFNWIITSQGGPFYNG